MTAVDPARDSQRLRVLRAMGLFDAPETPSLDRLARLAVRLLGAAAATVLLVDRERQTVLGAAGPAGKTGAHPQGTAEPGQSEPPCPFCEDVAAAGAPLALADTRDDGRCDDARTAHGLDVAAHLGFPLRTAGGDTLGSLSLTDTRPRQWSPEQLETAADLAATAESEIALWLARGEALLSATRLKTILDRTPDAFVSIDGDGVVTAWNAAAERLFGWSSEEAVGRDVADLVIPDQFRATHYQGLRRVRETGRSDKTGRRMELTARARDGREFPVEMTLQVDVEGAEPAFHAFVHDISSRHRAEMLREAQYAVARVLADADSTEQAAVGTVTAVTEALGWACGEYWRVASDETGITRICSWSRPGLDLSAFTDERPVTLQRGQGLPGLVWATRQDAWIRDMPNDPYDFVRKEAARRCGLHTAAGLPVHSGRQVFGVLTFFAETIEEPDDDLVAMLDGVCAHLGRYKERRRAEKLSLALDASRRHLDRVIAQLNDFVWTVEVTPDRRAPLIYTSPNSTGVFGGPIPPGTDILRLIKRHIHPDDVPAFDSYRAALAAGEPAEVEYRATGADGIVRWLWTRAIPRREDGRLFIDGITTDVTERHHLDEERERLLAQEQEQVRRLRDLDRMKDELVAVVSHELRTPIGAIRGYAEMLTDSPGLDDEHRMFADVIDRKSAHLQRLVDDLLDLARFDAGHIGLDPRPLSLTQLAGQAVDDHRPSADAKQLTLTADLTGRLPVHADPVRLRQVLDNLLSNAIRYTPAGGTVTLTAGREGDNAVIAVTDTGIGVPSEQYAQLFNRFFRASTALESGVKGTGLGLAITRAIVEAHGGTVSAAPRDGGGTVFSVRLPVDPSVET
ncbi:PAS domain S-box protein [Planomonospora sp. ID67723]|uniref:ATP-binding protein n=1 Tax=Planomonospora sp. ID67723 TaxID=2738134 RepID=UPI0018C408BF|nr:ATP-binding protein [Planomonospora sp. ID67723]MBG0826418.1 PAS domain S-box protein [Planomonospora sp. ID67723]